METLHIAPTASAGASLRIAIRDAGRSDEVLAFHDDLTCGPIAPFDPATRAGWWQRFHGDQAVSEAGLAEFWQRLDAAGDQHLVVWFGRESAREAILLRALVSHLGGRPIGLMDVTDLELPRRHLAGGETYRAQSVSVVREDYLVPLVGKHRRLKEAERTRWQHEWRQLQAENAGFRVVTSTGVASVQADHFDRFLLDEASTDWTRISEVVARVEGKGPYQQTGNAMLNKRVIDLVASGALLADGDPADPRTTKVRVS
ncbi:DUF3658 domain-containing protein [Nocardia sp. NPDC051832]|uniref:DUF3658 domain-containing protein n=1 Tax=Nocardia sp. NPDC051832 TaxID=3155673 RepID=UPI003427B6A2